MQMPDVTYLRTIIDGVPVVAASAEIDLTTAGQLRAVLLKASGAGHPAVVVDMTRTVFCDASGLHTLLRAHKRATSQGGELRLVFPAGGAVSRVIHLTCLDHLIPCFASLASALAPTPPRPGTASSAREFCRSGAGSPGLQERRSG